MAEITTVIINTLPDIAINRMRAEAAAIAAEAAQAAAEAALAALEGAEQMFDATYLPDGEIAIEFRGGKVWVNSRDITINNQYAETVGVLILETEVTGIPKVGISSASAAGFTDDRIPVMLNATGEPGGKIRLEWRNTLGTLGYPTNGGPYIVRVLQDVPTAQVALRANSVRIGKPTLTAQYNGVSSYAIPGGTNRVNLVAGDLYPLVLAGALTVSSLGFVFGAAGTGTAKAEDSQTLNGVIADGTVARGLSFGFKYTTTQAGVATGLVGMYTDANNCLMLWREADGSFRFRAAIAGSAFEVITETAAFLADGVEHSVNVVYDGNRSVWIYHDNELLANTTDVASTAAVRDFSTLAVDLTFGATGGYATGFVGTMDDLSIAYGHMWTDRDLFYISGYAMPDIIVLDSDRSGPITEQFYLDNGPILLDSEADVTALTGGDGVYYLRPYDIGDLIPGSTYRYFWLFSTDHAIAGEGGIFGFWSNDLDLTDRTDAALIWGPNQVGFPSYPNERQIETPFMVYNPDDLTHPFYIYYHTLNYGGPDNSQDTRLVRAESIDPLTGELTDPQDEGKILDADPAIEIHFGYFLPIRTDVDTWIGWSLSQEYLVSQGHPHLSKWSSEDGINWVQENDNYDNTTILEDQWRRVDISGFIPITLGGAQQYVLTTIAPYSSAGQNSANHRIVLIPLDDDANQTLIGPVQYLDGPPLDPEAELGGSGGGGTGGSSSKTPIEGTFQVGIRGMLSYKDNDDQSLIHLFPSYSDRVYHLIARIVDLDPSPPIEE